MSSHIREASGYCRISDLLKFVLLEGPSEGNVIIRKTRAEQRVKLLPSVPLDAEIDKRLAMLRDGEVPAKLDMVKLQQEAEKELAEEADNKGKGKGKGTLDGVEDDDQQTGQKRQREVNPEAESEGKKSRTG